MKNILLILVLFCSFLTQAQTNDIPYVKKEFLIIHSGKDYAAALKKATDASKKLKIPLDLRNLVPNKEIGLSHSQKSCDDDFGFFPCYIARGMHDDGIYVSIEYSDAYLEFEKGYYIILVSSFVSGNATSKTQLAKTKKIYKDAYLKASKVYTGCIH